jgi:hypothetical protein
MMQVEQADSSELMDTHTVYILNAECFTERDELVNGTHELILKRLLCLVIFIYELLHLHLMSSFQVHN